MLERMHGTSFDWLRWRGGELTNLGLANRYEIVKSNIHILRKYAVGYCYGNECLCRPKNNEVAIMFLQNDDFWWTHITEKEFELLK